LTIQVNGTSGGSDKTLGLFQYHLGAGAPDALGDGTTLHPIPLSYDYDLLTF